MGKLEQGELSWKVLVLGWKVLVLGTEEDMWKVLVLGTEEDRSELPTQPELELQPRSPSSVVSSSSLLPSHSSLSMLVGRVLGLASTGDCLGAGKKEIEYYRL